MDIFNWLETRGLKYNDKQLIEDAFVHSSYVNENPSVVSDNERLEFMGDAVLQLWVSDRLFNLQPKINEGEMTTFRASIVCEEALVQYGKKLKLNKYLKLGQGEERSGGRNRDSIVANMVEAFLGALYIDSGYASVDQVLSEVITFESKSQIQPAIIDYKTRLQEYIQTDVRKSLIYEVLKVTGPPNNPVFKIAAKTDEITLGIGEGSSKKRAEQNAAKNAFKKLVK